MKKGMVYSGTFMGILHGLDAALGAAGRAASSPRGPAGSSPRSSGRWRSRCSRRSSRPSTAARRSSGGSARAIAIPTLYLRGAVVGLGLGYGLTAALAATAMLDPGLVRVRRRGRGVRGGRPRSATRSQASRGRGRVQSWRVYLVQSLLGGFIGAAIGFYLDAAQVAVVVDEVPPLPRRGARAASRSTSTRCSASGASSTWATVNGGVSLLFAEALAGVISWSIPAWLFAINRTFMAAYFRKETAPIKALFTRDGLTQLTQNMIEVLRWGLWMSPIINSFLRPMGEPTWYNQDGAIRTLWAIFQDVRLSPEAFRAWSLQVFIALLAYDSVRILIWLDHMGLRVATLVNLSFLGMDRLDQRLARFLAPAATARCIPEAVKRFTTWAPLLIPYLHPPRQGLGLRLEPGRRPSSARPARASCRRSSRCPLPEQGLARWPAPSSRARPLFAAIRRLKDRFGAHAPSDLVAEQPRVRGDAQGERRGRQPGPRARLRRQPALVRPLDPAGRALFLVDPAQDAGDPARAWPVLGNFPAGARRAVADRARTSTS